MSPEPRISCSAAYLLGEGYEGLGPNGRALRVSSRELLDRDFELARGEYLPSAPIEFVRDQGQEPFDLVGTTFATLTLVSKRFLEVLTGHGFTGWATFPVRILLGEESELERFSGLAVTGRCGPLDDSLSGEVILPPPVPGGRSSPGLRGLCFPPDSWDGSDIFAAENYGGPFVVEDVKEAIEQAGITNVEFTRLSDVERLWRADGSLVARG